MVCLSAGLRHTALKCWFSTQIHTVAGEGEGREERDALRERRRECGVAMNRQSEKLRQLSRMGDGKQRVNKDRVRVHLLKVNIVRLPRVATWYTCNVLSADCVLDFIECFAFTDAFKQQHIATVCIVKNTVTSRGRNTDMLCNSAAELLMPLVSPCISFSQKKRTRGTCCRWPWVVLSSLNWPSSWQKFNKRKTCRKNISRTCFQLLQCWIGRVLTVRERDSYSWKL